MEDDIKDTSKICRMDTAPILLNEDKPTQSRVKNFFSELNVRENKKRVLFAIAALLILVVIAITATVALFRYLSIKYILKDVREAFVKSPFENHVTIKGLKEEDHARLLAEALFKDGSDYNPAKEVATYIEFNNFNLVYEKQHVNWDDKKKKFLAYRRNTIKIEEHNKHKNKSYTLKMNQFGDMTEEEFMKCYCGNMKLKNLAKQIAKDKKSKFEKAGSQNVESSSDVTKYVDYRKENILPPVKFQGQCGSCWAFATVSPIEALYAKQNKVITTFSEQQLVDCASENYGCNGGNPSLAYELALETGLHLEKDYPYTAKKNKCVGLKNKFKYKIAGYVSVVDPDLSYLLNKYGPLTSAVAASKKWQFYHSGIINECGSVISHAVNIVGIEKNENGEYYIIRNSWGTEWGDNGYAYIKKDNKSSKTDCGLKSFAFFPF